MIKEISGLSVRFQKVPAIAAFELLDNKTTHKAVAWTSVKVDGQWVGLTDDDVVNAVLPDWEALVEIETAAVDYNFGFLDSWRPIRVPASMEPQYSTITSRHANPIVSALVSAEMATILELREHYSLEEAFQMLDIATAKSVNEHKAMEQGKS